MEAAPRRPRAIGWWLIFTLPLGLSTWAAFLWAGLRTRRRDLLVSALIYGLLALVAVVASSADPHGAGRRIAEGVLPTLWIVGIVHALLVRRDVAVQLALADPAARARAEYVAARRAYGRELLAHDPALARQLGVGRPDRPGIDSFALVDVNHADAAALAVVPGLGADEVRRILEHRERGQQFASAEELAGFLDLPPAVLGPLADATVFDVGS